MELFVINVVQKVQRQEKNRLSREEKKNGKLDESQDIT